MAFDKQKPLTMDYTTLTTQELLDTLAEQPLNATESAVLNELQVRIIKEGDADDDSSHRGGIRPKHAPTI